MNFNSKKHKYYAPEKVKLAILDIFLIILLIALTSRINAFFNQNSVELSIVIAVGFYFFVFKFSHIEPLIYRVLFYLFLVQVIAMIRFNELNIDRLLSLGLFYTRVITAYLILKLGGYNILLKYEKISFLFILIGIPIFFIVQHIPGANSFFSQFDINSIELQIQNGGWNIFLFQNNGWGGYRYSSYGGEPGMGALFITVSWIIHIIYRGTKVTRRVVVYFIAMILTFSTTGYFVLLILILFYMLNAKRKIVIFRAFVLGVLLAFSLPYIWQQEFISGKIVSYLERDTKIKESGGYENVEYNNVGRLGAIYVGYNNFREWPLGRGTTSKERIMTNDGEIVSGANGVIWIFVTWGLIGGIFFIYSLYFLVTNLNINNNLKLRWLLLLPLIFVFSSNTVLSRALVFLLVLYPHIYLFPFNKYQLR